MKSIIENPFRVLGVLSNAKASEIKNNRNKIKAFIAADQMVELDYDFPVFGQLNRTDESVNTAISVLNLDQDKILNGLFWFYYGNHTDEPAFDFLKESDINNAAQLWKDVSKSLINERNCSAYFNLSTLLLFNAARNGTIDYAIFTDALTLKLSALESEFLNTYCNAVADHSFLISKEALQSLFLKNIEENFIQKGQINMMSFIKILNGIQFSAKATVLKSFVNKPIEEIENKVDQTKTNRKSDSASAVEYGKWLFEKTKDDLNLHKSVLGGQELKYSAIADKIADEVLQCGIDYFKKFKDSDSVDPGSSSMSCFKLAKSVVVGSIVTQRCNENITNLQEWIDDPDRIKFRKIKQYFEPLKNLIDEFEDQNETISNAVTYLNRAKPLLQNIKAILGSTDSLYLGLSTRVASGAQSYIINEVNVTQDSVIKSAEQFGGDRRIASMVFLGKFKEVLAAAWNATVLLGSLDMLLDFKTNRYNTNKESLRKLCDQVGVFSQSSSPSSSSPRSTTRSTTSSSGGCYIATMVYGSYDAPQVLVLRRFRDDVLINYSLGRKFINYYYRHSPGWVAKMQDNQKINSILRSLLNVIVKSLKS